MVDQINFYEPDEAYGFLSNFCHAPIDVDGHIWPTSEHYYQAQKFSDPLIKKEIQHCSTPDLAFSLSRKHQDKVRSQWEDERLNVMKFIVTEKFTQNSQLAFQLIETGESLLIEHSLYDGFWGDGENGRGENQLGKILMDLRTQLRNSEPYNLVQFVDSAKLPTKWGTFHMYGFFEEKTGKEHLALVYGDLSSVKDPLIRLHSECLTGDALFSQRCDCGFQLDRALKNIAEEGTGVLLYLRQEGRGIGLLNKIRAYHLQDDGADTVEANERLGFAADLRDYRFCKGMLCYLGVKSVRLMTNNPFKVQALERANIHVAERVALQEGCNPDNLDYLKTKVAKLGHLLDEEFIK
ncbi:GTP cyclohydrolase II [Vibrio ostreicida]|uniref:GTP cyclohydrolase-2 n=1 Tax=Vibrio ostreicida TaxID=526588 RepID=A0ABT8C002_9VIBR|nr:GTP cyclohydrolase II [Vibrio ostreicida]MDN3611961.1 GTP cyclohydrolase II [Vibrio ostreicida]NPD08860.1 GTP cyclohydrolase II [Vibrio ostreicida]